MAAFQDRLSRCEARIAELEGELAKFEAVEAQNRDHLEQIQHTDPYAAQRLHDKGVALFYKMKTLQIELSKERNLLRLLRSKYQSTLLWPLKMSSHARAESTPLNSLPPDLLHSIINLSRTP